MPVPVPNIIAARCLLEQRQYQPHIRLKIFRTVSLLLISIQSTKKKEKKQ